MPTEPKTYFDVMVADFKPQWYDYVARWLIHWLLVVDAIVTVLTFVMWCPGLAERGRDWCKMRYTKRMMRHVLSKQMADEHAN